MHAMGIIRMSSFRTSRRSSSGVCAGTTGARSSTLSAFSSSTDVFCFSSRDIARCGGQEEMSGGLTGPTKYQRERERFKYGESITESRRSNPSPCMTWAAAV